MSKEILKDFQRESKNLIGSQLEILAACEGNFSQVLRLEEYGQIADRIMGAAKTLALTLPNPQHMIHKIADYTALCKLVGTKTSQIKENEGFYIICVAFLQDATEMLREMIEFHFESSVNFKELFSQTFLDRLRWLSEQFSDEYKDSLDVHKKRPGKMSQDEIDLLMAKLGLN